MEDLKGNYNNCARIYGQIIKGPELRVSSTGTGKGYIALSVLCTPPTSPRDRLYFNVKIKDEEEEAMQFIVDTFKTGDLIKIMSAKASSYRNPYDNKRSTIWWAEVKDIAAPDTLTYQEDYPVDPADIPY